MKSAGHVSNATVNRMLALLRSILRRACSHWEWLESVPQVRLLREPSRRVRFLTREQAERLIAELPEHLADMAVFSLSTGLRASNVTGLQWSQLNLDNRLAWIHADQSKLERPLMHCKNWEVGNLSQWFGVMLIFPSGIYLITLILCHNFMLNFFTSCCYNCIFRREHECLISTSISKRTWIRSA